MSPETHQLTQREFDEAIEWLSEHCWIDIELVEHAIEHALLRHELWLTIPPKRPLNPIWFDGSIPIPIDFGGGTVMARVVVFHPEACGCALLPDQVLLYEG